MVQPVSTSAEPFVANTSIQTINNPTHFPRISNSSRTWFGTRGRRFKSSRPDSSIRHRYSPFRNQAGTSGSCFLGSTATLKLGDKLTLVNTADGTRYVIVLKAKCEVNTTPVPTAPTTTTSTTTTTTTTTTATTPIVTDSLDTTTPTG